MGNWGTTFCGGEGYAHPPSRRPRAAYTGEEAAERRRLFTFIMARGCAMAAAEGCETISAADVAAAIDVAAVSGDETIHVRALALCMGGGFSWVNYARDGVVEICGVFPGAIPAAERLPFMAYNRALTDLKTKWRLGCQAPLPSAVLR